MNERRYLTLLTQIALFDAVVLFLISLQFVSPPLFVILLWLASVVFAVEACITPLPLTLLSSALMLTVTIAAFGPLVGIWSLVYIATGLVAGLLRRWRWPLLVRLPLAGIAFCGSIVGVFALYFWLSGLSFALVVRQFDLSQLTRLAMQFAAVLAAMVAIFALVVASTVDALTGRIVTRLRTLP
jgi:hypothetical protein